MLGRLEHRKGFIGTLIGRGREVLRFLAASRHGIGARLLIGVLLISTFVTVILTALQLNADYRRDAADVESRLERIGAYYLDSLAEGLWNLDEKQLRLQLDALLRLPNIRGVEIREASSKGNLPSLKLSRDPEDSTFAREYSLHHDVQGQDRVIGTLRVEATLANVYRKLAKNASTILLTQSATIFLVSLFIFYFFHHLVTRHLAAIAADVGSHRIKDAPLELRLRRPPSRHEDELQRVVTAFNALSHNLHIAYSDLAEREAKIRRLTDANIIGIIIWDIDGRIIEANDAFLRVVGYDREDLLSGWLRWTDLTAPEWQGLDAQGVEELKRTGIRQPFEKEYVRKDGSRVPVLAGGTLFQEGGNEGVAFVLDLTEQKKAETALRASEDRFRDYVDVASDWFWETGRDHRFTEFSRSAAGWGLSIGKTRWDLAGDSEEDPEKWRDHIGTLDARQPFRGFRYRIPHPDGSARHLSVSGKPVFDDNGRFLGYRGVATDVSAEVRAEKALRESEERFRTLMQFSFDVYWETDAQHRFIRQDFSERVADGPLPGSELGKTRWELPYLDIDEDAWRKHREMLDAHLPFRDLEYARPTPSGGKRWAAISGLPIFDEAGRFLGYRGVGRHITERKRIEEELRQREKELREIVDTIPAMTVTITADGRDAFIGKQFSEYSGLSEEQARGSGWRVTVHPDDLDLYLRTWRASLASGKPAEFETRVRRADGEYRWFLARAVAQRDDRGNILKWYEVLTDIEDRKRAELALGRSEAHLAEAQKLTHTGSGAIDPASGKTTYLSEEMFRIHGIEPGLGFPGIQEYISRFVHLDDSAGVREAFERASREKGEFTQDYRIVLPGGTVKHLHVIGHPVLDKTGEPIEYFGTMADVTEREQAQQGRERAEAALRERDAMVRSLVDANIIGVFTWRLGSSDKAGDAVIQEVNDAFLRIVGYDRIDLAAGSLSQRSLTAPDWQDRTEGAMAEMQLNGAFQPYEKEYIRKDGSRVPVLVGAAQFGDTGDSGVAFVLDLTEQKRAEAVLRESEARVRHLIDANIIGIFIGDFDGNIVDANDAYLQLLGYDREDLLSGRINWVTITPPELLYRSKRALQEMKSVEKAQLYEKEYIRKDGSRVPALVGATVFSEGRGLGFVLDLTEQKRAEAALRERDAMVRGLVDANIIGTFTWRRDRAGGAGFWPVFQDVNDAFLRIVGYDREDLATGTSTWILTPPDWVDRTQRAADEMQLNGAFQPYEKVFLRKDGSRVPVLVGAAQTGDTGIAFVIDLTEQKRVETALRESEEQWKAVFENNPIMYFMVGENGTILSVNPFGAEQLCYTVDELVGCPVTMVFYEPDRGTVQKNAAACFERPGEAMSWELRKVRKNGDLIWVRETARATFINSRLVLLIVCEDITESKRVSEALREAQFQLAHANRVAAMGQLTASIAHEVRQPLAAVKISGNTALRWLTKSPPEIEETKLSIESILRDTNRANDVISRILGLVKKAAPSKDAVDINEAILGVLALTQAEAAKQGVTVQIQLADNLPKIRGDRVQLQQVLINLIINAIQAMSAIEGKREIHVSTACEGLDGIRVAVQDSGPGLSVEKLPHLFEPFYTTKPDGMGMGLSISRTIIEDHGGRLWASEHAPSGALFQFTIPLS